MMPAHLRLNSVAQPILQCEPEYFFSFRTVSAQDAKHKLLCSAKGEATQLKLS